MRAASRLGRIAILLQLIAMVSLLGCSTVSLQHPIGAPVPAEERQRLAGIWLAGAEESPIHVAFDSDRAGTVARLEWQAGTFRLLLGELHLIVSGEVRILSLRAYEKDQPSERIYFVRYAFTDSDEIVMWLPKVAVFEEAVAGKKIAGDIFREKHETHVVLKALPQAILDFVAAAPEPFDLQRPIVLRKIARISHGAFIP